MANVATERSDFLACTMTADGTRQFKKRFSHVSVPPEGLPQADLGLSQTAMKMMQESASMSQMSGALEGAISAGANQALLDALGSLESMKSYALPLNADVSGTITGAVGRDGRAAYRATLTHDLDDDQAEVVLTSQGDVTGFAAEDPSPFRTVVGRVVHRAMNACRDNIGWVDPALYEDLKP